MTTAGVWFTLEACGGKRRAARRSDKCSQTSVRDRGSPRSLGEVKAGHHTLAAEERAGLRRRLHIPDLRANARDKHDEHGSCN